MIDQIQQLLAGAFRQDSLTLYFLMFGGGVLASFTPCTYPVIPLTVGYIGNHAGDNRWRVFLLSLSLVTGLATVYALLGVAVAAVGGTFGSIMGNGPILYAIAMYYLLMGLFLLDVFHFPTPRFLYALQSKSANRQGMLGAFAIGGVSGLIVGPCTGPILAVALGAIAMTLTSAQGVAYALQVAKGGILLFLFGFGQGALILLAGIFTGFLYKLPKAGLWMEAVKKGFAYLIIVTATLLFVFVGQNTDFPSLTRLLASAESSPAPAAPPATAPQGPPAPAATATSQLAPDFTLPALEKGTVTLSHLRGKQGVVLVFFATWCVNCMKEVPEIKHFNALAKKEQVALYAINYKQSAEIVARFKQSMQVDYPLLLDGEGTVTTGSYGITGLPHIVGINARGEVIYRGVALPEDREAFLRNLRQGA